MPISVVLHDLGMLCLLRTNSNPNGSQVSIKSVQFDGGDGECGRSRYGCVRWDLWSSKGKR